MNRFTPCAAGAAAALVMIAPIATASPAHASVTRHWTTIEKINGGKQEACKVSVNGGKAWKISSQLDARQVKAASGKLEATLTVTLHGKPTKRVWDSRWVNPRHISSVGTITLPRVAGHGLMMTIHGTNSGSGGTPKIANIGRC